MSYIDIINVKSKCIVELQRCVADNPKVIIRFHHYVYK